MQGMFGRRVVLVGAFALMLAGAGMARAETVNVSIDKAHIMKMPERVATIVIGNPLIADATLQSGGVLVVTGKGFGSTNMVGLDRSGNVVMTDTVQVVGPAADDIVVVFKGTARESYSCAPDCERRLTLGDSQTFFNGILNQAGSRTGGGANGNANGGNAAR